MAKLTTTEFIQKLEGKVKALEQNNIPLEIGVRSTMALQVLRIFQEGRNSAGGQIGTYSTKPVVISPKNAPRKFDAKTFVPFNKAQRSRTGKKGYYGKFFAGGYKEFKADQGRESSFVNLRLANDLQSDFANSQVSATSNAVATPVPIKLSTHVYVSTLKRQQNIDKKNGLEKKYGRIFPLTKEEREGFSRVVSFELKKFLAA